ncbi:hypothetical protein HOS95_gp11 [Salmonella phage vB_SpuP_Spp16]|uniref:Uncharacterized protein n=1 Tax=Salmonella phage vB_SpuP_Spp16 TaxID=2081603 RepID=A0A2P9JZT2_9CAUD|nr:hypothetical protein HOS95_gp11 [Salmonella phage vB_SpuP_Spp16]AVI05048.1 hypothetical protein [Salmonella phage vB_SpuP_Spp16]
MSWQVNNGRKRSPVKRGTLIDVVMRSDHYNYTAYVGNHVEKTSHTINCMNYICVTGAVAGEDIKRWSIEGSVGDVLMWREHDDNSKLPTKEMIEEVLNNG